MKITKVNYKDGFAWFVVDNDTTKTYGIKMKGKKLRIEITTELKKKVTPNDEDKIIFDNLKVKELEGTDI